MTHPWTYRAELLSDDIVCHDCQRYVLYNQRMPARYLIVATHQETGAERLGRYCREHAQAIARRRGFELPAMERA